MKEIWKDINGYEGLYQVSNMGRVKSIGRYITFDNGWSNEAKMYIHGGILEISKQSQGYSQVSLCKKGRRITKRLNRLVAIAFLPNPYNKPQVNHIDGNKSNNCANNLEWVTDIENKKHAKEHGLLRPYKRSVIKMDLAGNILEVYESGNDAAIKNNLSRAAICHACKGKAKTSGGFRWRYKDERK